MTDFIGNFEVLLDGLDEPVEVEARCSYVTERFEYEPFSDGRSRGYGRDTVSAQIDELIIGPLSYSRSGAIVAIGAEQVSLIEASAFDAAGA